LGLKVVVLPPVVSDPLAVSFLELDSEIGYVCVRDANNSHESTELVLEIEAFTEFSLADAE
jgi:hypothetical protein